MKRQLPHRTAKAYHRSQRFAEVSNLRNRLCPRDLKTNYLYTKGHIQPHHLRLNGKNLVFKKDLPRLFNVTEPTCIGGNHAKQLRRHAMRGENVVTAGVLDGRKVILAKGVTITPSGSIGTRFSSPRCCRGV
jgi:hypothetical protein